MKKNKNKVVDVQGLTTKRDEIDYHYPFKGTIWEDLTLEKFLQMEEGEKQKVRDYLEEIDAPFDNFWEIDGQIYIVSSDHPTWRDILSWEDKDIQMYIDYYDLHD